MTTLYDDITIMKRTVAINIIINMEKTLVDTPIFYINHGVRLKDIALIVNVSLMKITVTDINILA